MAPWHTVAYRGTVAAISLDFLRCRLLALHGPEAEQRQLLQLWSMALELGKSAGVVDVSNTSKDSTSVPLLAPM